MMGLVEILTLLQSGSLLTQNELGWHINGQDIEDGRGHYLEDQGFIQQDKWGEWGWSYCLTDKGKSTDPKEIMFV